MIRASALFIVIVISFLLASITGGIVYYTFYYKMQVSNHVTFHKLSHNLNSAIAYSLSLPESQEVYSKEIDLYGEGLDSAKISGKIWGVYHVASVSVSSKNVKLEKSFMCGYAPDKESNAAIYLKNSDRGLKVAGKTTIRGTCYVPQGVVKTTSIDGYLYQGPSQPIDGEIIKSTDTEVAVNKLIITQLEALLRFSFIQESSSVSDTVGMIHNDTLIRSFSEPTLYMDYHDERLKSIVYIEGNVVLYSERHIDLKKELNIKDALLIAPSIKFPTDYKGMLQVVCSDSIVLEQGVSLEYPSALVLIKKNIANANPRIILKENTVVRGLLFAYSDQLNDDKVYINLTKGAMVNGQLYTNGSIDCQGAVYGGLMCKTFLLKTNTSINENYLLNATIDVKKRSIYFTGSSLLPAKNKKRIIKYL